MCPCSPNSLTAADTYFKSHSSSRNVLFFVVLFFSSSTVQHGSLLRSSDSPSKVLIRRLLLSKVKSKTVFSGPWLIPNTGQTLSKFPPPPVLSFDSPASPSGRALHSQVIQHLTDGDCTQKRLHSRQLFP